MALLPETKLKKGEKQLAKAAANLFRGLEGVGGFMRITNQRILFEPHAINLQSEPEEIPLSKIKEVGKRSTGGFIPNGMLIVTKSGKEYKFVVWNREKWINLIQSQLSK